MSYDFIIVGSGLSGAVLAHQFAIRNYKILMLEKRDHLFGNVYDYEFKNILIHKYGPHIFHTSNERVFKFMSQFWTLNNFKNSPAVLIGNQFTPIPFNFKGIDLFFNENKEVIKRKLINKFGFNKRVSILELMDVDDKDIQKVATFVYKNIYENYTTKMWGINPDKIDKFILKRVPITTSYEEGYFLDKYEGIPVNGYSNAIKKMVDLPNIVIKKNIDGSQLFNFNKNQVFFKGELYEGIVIYCGPLDELFDYRFGTLPYRSLDIKLRNINKVSYQKTAVTNYPAHKTISRITEYKKMTFQKAPNTVISIEKPGAYDAKSENFNIPYYPVFSKSGKTMFEKYWELTQKIPNFFPLGRLATFQYLDMHVAIKQALELSDKILIQLEKNEK